MATRGQGLFSLYIYIENLKNLLVRNYWTNCNIIWQKCSFGDPLLRLFKPFGFVKKHGCQGAGFIFPIYLYRKKSSCQKPLDRLRYNLVEKFLWWSSTKIVQAIWIRQKTWPPGGEAYFPYTMYIYIENLKNLLVRNYWTNCNIIWHKCSFGNPLPRLFKPFGFFKKTWPPGGHQGAGLIFPIYLYWKHKKSSCQKLLDQLQYNLSEMFLWWSSTKTVRAIWIHQKTWLPWSIFFPIYLYRKL